MTSDTHTINVNISFQDRPVKLDITDSTTVEDVIVEVCKELKISPVTRHLFALKNTSLSRNAWLSLSHRILEDKIKKHYEFAIRFKVPDVNRLRSIDLNTYNFYFRQAKQGILRNSIPNINIDKHESDIIGLGVVDMFRAIVEDGLSKQHVIRNYRNYVPVYVLRRHPFFLKKPVIQKFEEIRVRNVDSWYLKSAYLEAFKRIAPSYLVEEFNALIVRNDAERLYSAVIRVNPFDAAQPGISIKEEYKEWEHVCAIEDLCYINMRSNGTVEISRKNGIPLYVKFQMITDMTSFVTLLDGYYRLITKWTFNLCKDLPTPSLQKLFPLKCHGPVSGEFAYRKLAEKRNNEAGSFILRESDLDYDSYYIDVCTKSSSTPKTLKIEKTNDGRFRLNEEEKLYSSIPDLIKDHRSQTDEHAFLHCLPPSEYDQSNLLLCQINNSSNSRAQSADEELPSTSPVCIDARTLMVFKNMPRDGRSSFTTVYPGVWNVSNAIKRNVAIKVLEKNDQQKNAEKYQQRNLPEFLSLTSRWAFVNANTVVKLYGVTLSNPVAMVMEHLPLGQLDVYLADVKNRAHIKEVTLVEASTYLANALYYLAEAKFVHGYIRCRKLLVAAHTDNSFVVKLADPGLGNPYTDFDLHWIPPEYHNDPNAARETIRSDVWAFATTLWEIFSYGAVPTERDIAAIKKFYSSPRNYLPIPNGCPKMVYYLMLECWSYDPYSRKTPQGIMRDINQIFYQVYNSRLINQYTAITPSFDCEPDNVSNNSKTSGGCSTSLLSEVTLNTLLDDGDAAGSLDVSLRHMNLNGGNYQSTNMFAQGYRCITDRNEMLALSGQQDHSSEAFNSISSMQSIFELDKEWNLVLKGLIGEGFYGQVFKGELHHHYDEKEPQKVAVKKLKREAMVNIANHAELDKEISTMLKLEHPNIVKIIGRVQDPELCLVLEYIEHGSLKCYLNIHKEWLSPHRLLKFALDIAKGMAYLNEMKYVHRDLAARNILVSDYSVKISDFGLARFIGNNNYYYYNKPDRDLPIKWYAPESIEQSKFSFQSDVWSYGVTLYEMFTFGAEPQLPNVGQKAEEICEALRNNVRLPMPPKCPQYIYTKIMVPCWQYEAAQRPTFVELCMNIEDVFNMQQS